MIQFLKDGLALSPMVARALLAFAAKEDAESRSYLCSIGIDEGDVCATDGHAGVRFQKVTLGDGANSPFKLNGRLFRRSIVEKALVTAKAKGHVWLPWSALDTVVGGFPKLHKAEPKPGLNGSDGAVALGAALLARLEVVALACRRDRVTGEDCLPESPAAVLRSLGGYLDPVGWVIGGDEWPTSVHTAYVTIMPMRVHGPGQSADEQVLEMARRKVQDADKKKQRLALQREQRAVEKERKRVAKEQAAAKKAEAA